MNEKQALPKETPALEKGAMNIVERLAAQGYEAYLVGGCVRDKQLLRPVKDYDIATSARPEQVQQLFERTIPTGLQHGTVTVMVGKTPYEVTTFRKEAEYEAFRRPAGVEYIDSLLEDLQRRDFTMNAMAIDRNGELVDPFGGLQDLEHGILRCVGNPIERFGEDALRIFRCLRFASEYRLAIHEATWNGLLVQVPLLKHIAMERVRAELERMIEGRWPEEALRLLTESEALSYVKERLRLSELPKQGAWSGLSSLASEERWACLYLWLNASAEAARDDMRLLTFANQRQEAVARILQAHELLTALAAEGTPEPKAWKLTVLQAGTEAVRRLAAIYSKDEQLRPARDTAVEAAGAHREPWSTLVNQWISQMPVTELKELKITGKELIAGFEAKAGPWVGRLLTHLLQETALGSLPNDKNALLTEAKSVYSRMQER